MSRNQVVIETEVREIRLPKTTMETKDIKEQMKTAVLSEVALWSDEFKSITDGYEFEERLLQRVRAIGKIMMQQSVGAVPQNRNKKKLHPCLGEIEVDKRHPVAEVNPKFGISQRLQEMMCMSGQRCVFEEGEQLFLQMMGIAVSARQIQRVSEYYGQKLEEEEMHKAKEGIRQNATNDKPDEPVYVMVDGSMVFTREEGWKEMKPGRIFAAKNQIEQSASRSNISTSQYVIH